MSVLFLEYRALVEEDERRPTFGYQRWIGFTVKPSLASVKDTESVISESDSHRKSSFCTDKQHQKNYSSLTTMRVVNVLSVWGLVLTMVMVTEAFETTKDAKNDVVTLEERGHRGGPAHGTDQSISHTWENFKAWFKKTFYFWQKREQKRRLRSY